MYTFSLAQRVIRYGSVAGIVYFSEGKRISSWRWKNSAQSAAEPALSGIFLPPIELIERCVALDLPFVTIANGNYEELWPEMSSLNVIAAPLLWRVAVISSQRPVCASLKSKSVVISPTQKSYGANTTSISMLHRFGRARSKTENCDWPVSEDCTPLIRAKTYCWRP